MIVTQFNFAIPHLFISKHLNDFQKLASQIIDFSVGFFIVFKSLNISSILSSANFQNHFRDMVSLFIIRGHSICRIERYFKRAEENYLNSYYFDSVKQQLATFLLFQERKALYKYYFTLFQWIHEMSRLCIFYRYILFVITISFT